MTPFVHPAKEDITLTGVFGALADPMRLEIFRYIMAMKNQEISCSMAAPCHGIAKSTLSHHFRVLRDAGIIHTEKKGVEHRNTIRLDDINSRFPGLVDLILSLPDER